MRKGMVLSEITREADFSRPVFLSKWHLRSMNPSNDCRSGIHSIYAASLRIPYPVSSEGFDQSF